MPKLPFHEWIIISLFIALLLMIAAITLFRKNDKMPQIASKHELSAQIVQVSVRGAVNKPGTYEFKKGAILKELLEQAQTLVEADLSRIKTEAKLRDGQIVKVPVQKWITVYVQGAGVEARQLRVKFGTLLNELPPLLTFEPNADKEKLQRKRRLKDQEVITVALKKTTNKKASVQKNKKL
jgi:DNA uptake protein ComE-like DNA-binding protein